MVEGGQQVGFAEIDGAWKGGLWNGSAASWVDLTPPGWSYSEVRDVRNGVQAGWAADNAIRATLWNGNSMSFTSLHPTGAEISMVAGLDGDTQAGSVDFGQNWRAGIWHGTAASWTSMHPQVQGIIFSIIHGAGGGQQVGHVTISGVGDRASLWMGTAASWVNLHPDIAEESYAFDSDSGQQVGQVQIEPIGFVASLWSGTAASWVNLNPNGAVYGKALGVHKGKQVGFVTLDGVERASLWSGTAESWVDLHSMMPSNYAGSQAFGVWHDASGISVVGNAFNTLTQRREAVLWVQSVPEPATLSVLGCGAILLLKKRRSKRS